MHSIRYKKIMNNDNQQPEQQNRIEEITNEQLVPNTEPIPPLPAITLTNEEIAKRAAEPNTSQLVCQACKPEAGKTISVTAENKCVVCGKDIPINSALKSEPNRQADGRFGPGNVANPKGRPKRDWTWKEVLEDIAQMYVKKKDGTISKKTYKEMVAQRLFSLSIGGNIHAIKEIMNRMDGMPTQTIEAEVDNKGSIVVYKPEKNAE